MSSSRTLALVRHAKLQDSDDYFKEVKISKSKFKRYSPKALEVLQSEMAKVDMEDIWQKHRPKRA